MKVNYQSNASTQFRVLSELQCEEIYFAMLHVLEQTGVDVYNDEALQLLKSNGAIVDDHRVYIPSQMVKSALASAPPRFTVYGRNGTKALLIEPNRVYFGPGPTCPNFLDPNTDERRMYLRKDAAATALVCDALENIDFVMSLGTISDVEALHEVSAERSEQSLADVYEFVEMMENTVKPIVAWSFSLESCKDIHRIALAIAGGEEKFARKPNYFFYAEPLSPLTSNREASEKLLYCVEHSIPLIYTPCPIAGGTAPATFAGVLVNALAEAIHGLVIAQLKRPGTPFVIGGVVSIMDMSDMVLSYGAPELGLISAALTDVVKYLGMPMWSTGGCTDAKIVDEQAALESALSVAMAQLSGANLVHDVGYIESALTGSLDMLVMSDEIISMVRHITRGIEVNEETLAVDVIDEVKPGGNFLETEHTFKHYRREFWFPKLMDRRNHGDWVEAGGETLGDRANDKVKNILATHTVPPLSKEVREKIEDILAIAENR
ncbi:trimethylamine methyltransferase family protein [bacterium]|nr:trimethylamine methyltransferase family protein [bacterium]